MAVRTISLIAILASGGLAVGRGAASLDGSERLALEDVDAPPKPGSSTTSTTLAQVLPPSGIDKIPEVVPNAAP